jgi:hypothetical protein
VVVAPNLSPSFEGYECRLPLTVYRKIIICFNTTIRSYRKMMKIDKSSPVMITGATGTQSRWRWLCSRKARPLPALFIW